MATGKPQRILGDALIWDNHGCMPLRPDDDGFLPLLERVRAAGIHIYSLNISYAEQGGESAYAMARAFTDWIAARPTNFLLVRNIADVAAARASGRLGICFDMEGMSALDGDIERVAHFYALGVRWMLAAYNRGNAAGGGCLEPEDGGLTAFGRAVVAEMNRVGMVVCASHCGTRTARAMIDASQYPVIFSHSNPAGVWDHPRNIGDELAKACAARGGVIGLNGFGPFLGANDARPATFAAHVEYLLDLVGDDHVGIGLDYVFDRAELDEFFAADPATFPPEHYGQGAQMIAPWHLGLIAGHLRERGHTQATLRKLFGGNHWRIARQVWK